MNKTKSLKARAGKLVREISLRKSDKRGFTIIEVLIVLAIAGLILLIVFLAVPALQRNSRNHQRSADASSIIAAYNEYINNSGGGIPMRGVSCNGTSPCPWLANAKASFYNLATTQFQYWGESAINTPGVPYDPVIATGSIEYIWMYGGYTQCNSPNSAPVTSTNSNSSVIVYDLEKGGGGYSTQCRSAG